MISMQSMNGNEICFNICYLSQSFKARIPLAAKEEQVSDNQFAHILRINNEEAERILFVRKMLFVSVKRAWTCGSKVLFVKKANTILGSGVIELIRQIEDMDLTERNLCLQRNWCAKIYFSELARFLPPVPVETTPISSRSPLTLHGSEISRELVLRIEEHANIKIIT